MSGGAIIETMGPNPSPMNTAPGKFHLFYFFNFLFLFDVFCYLNHAFLCILLPYVTFRNNLHFRLTEYGVIILLTLIQKNYEMRCFSNKTYFCVGLAA